MSRPTSDRGAFALTDFPDGQRGAVRWHFEDPVDVITTHDLREVRDCLARVEARAREGWFAVGFVAYEAAPAFDPALRVNASPSTPLLWFGIFEEPMVPPESSSATPADEPGDWQPHVGRARYEHTVNESLNRIRDGAFYQVNHTIRLRSPWPAGAVATYDALRAAQPSSYGMCLDIGGLRVVSVSPELFFSRRGRTIETRPMKGTAPRQPSAAADATVARALAYSVKDRAENVMIVDLVRNDLGRIAELGTINVPRLFDVERHPTLWQMTSTITACLRPEIQLPEIFDALFPSGSVVGAPKIAAAAWIADREHAPRGVYCGALGVVQPGGDCTFSVGIRTLVIDRDAKRAEYGTGGAITIDSTPQGEYDELIAKAAILSARPSAFDLLETMRLSDGVYRRRERHARRLLASADYFDFPDVREALDRALDDEAARVPEGDYRVRLLVARDGTARTEATPIAGLATPVRPLRCAMATTPVSSRDPFLYHKTTNRAIYDERRAAHRDVDEIILINERGELTECSIGNVVVELNGERCTPPPECGLLPGVFREELIEAGMVRERVLHPADLANATGTWLVNSLREWVELVVG